MKYKLLICCFLFLVIAVMPACNSNSGKIKDLETKVSNLTSTLQQKQSDYDALTTQHNNLKEDYAVLEQHSTTDISRLNDQVSTLKGDKSNLTSQIGQLQAERDRLNIQVAQLTKELMPSPDHALTWTQVKNDPDLRSTSWAGLDYELRSKTVEIGRQYHASHIYIAGETDCNDMTIDIWNMLLAQNIKSVIVIGNLDNPLAGFSECDHAWLNVFDPEGLITAIEPTTGQVFYGDTPGADPYWTGSFLYKKPSDLRSDIMKRW